MPQNITALYFYHAYAYMPLVGIEAVTVDRYTLSAFQGLSFRENRHRYAAVTTRRFSYVHLHYAL